MAVRDTDVARDINVLKTKTIHIIQKMAFVTVTAIIN